MAAAITLDMKKQRIRIHKKTLELLNNPEYVLILVNPHKSAIAVCPTDSEQKDSLKISYDDSDCEYYSKELMTQLSKLRLFTDQSYTYRIKGNVLNNGRIAIFDMNDAVRYSDPPDQETNTTGSKSND